MRIEAYSQVQKVYQKQASGKSQKNTSNKEIDKLQISSFGKDIQIAKTALQEIPDIREEVIAPIKEKLDNNTYEVSKESFAEKLWMKYKER